MGWLRQGGGRIVAAALAVAVCGCVTDGGISPSSSVDEVPISRAFMVPPPGGPAIVSVIEQRYANAIAQDIVLQNNTALAQPNALYVRAFGPMGRDAGVGTLSQDVPSLAGVQNELRSRFPGVPMQISGLYAQNRYGALGYATGRAHGNNCIYVWQRIAAEPSLFRFEVGSITWRLRLCDPNTSLRDLLVIAYGFTITGSFKSQRWNPFGEPPPPDPRIGQPGVVILPETVVEPTVVATPVFGAGPAARRTTRSTVRRRPVATPAALNLPASGAAVVPRPQNTDLSEPTVRGSNLPEIAPRTDGALPPTSEPPTPTPGTPTVLIPQQVSPPRVRVITPD